MKKLHIPSVSSRVKSGNQSCYCPSLNFGSGHSICLPFVLLFVLLCPLEAFAQDNVYGIRNELLDDYLAVEKIKGSKECMQPSEELFQRAVKIGDGKAQCLALTAQLLYYKTLVHEDSMLLSSQRLKDVAKEQGYNQYYFWALAQEIEYFRHHGQTRRAIAQCSQMKEEADRAHYYYGLYLVMKTTADIYRDKGDYLVALQSYKQALDIARNYCPEQSPTHTCGSILKIYFDNYWEEGRLDSIDHYLRLMEQVNKIDLDVVYINLWKANALFENGRYEEFMKASDELLDDVGSNNDLAIRMRVRRHIVERDYEAAIHEAEKMPTPTRYLLFAMIFRHSNDWEKAYRNVVNYQLHVDTLRSSAVWKDFDEIAVQIGKTTLEEENLQLTTAERKRREELTTGIFVLLVVIIIVAIFVILKMRRTNKQLAIARDKAVQSERVKMAFLQNMSHEIRTPLNAIVGFSELIIDRSDQFTPDQLDEFKDIVKKNNDLLLVLIGDILTIADLESGRYHVSLDSTNVVEMCDQAIATVQNRVKPGVELKTDYKVEAGQTIVTDEIRHQQLLTNLLTNACKYTESGSIELSCRLLTNNRIEFSVTDTGPGIPPDKRAEIFERFIKLDSFHQGTGLGLSICSEITKLLKGKIFVDPDYTGGTRFVFQMPMGNQEGQ